MASLGATGKVLQDRGNLSSQVTYLKAQRKKYIAFLIGALTPLLFNPYTRYKTEALEQRLTVQEDYI